MLYCGTDVINLHALCCVSQIRPLNCGRSASETRGLKVIIWKMRRGDPRTSLLSPPYRYTFTHTHTHTQTHTHTHTVKSSQVGSTRGTLLLISFSLISMKPFLYSTSHPSTPSCMLIHLYTMMSTGRFPCSNPQTWWWRCAPGECSPTDTPTTSTLSRSTATVRRTCRLTTSASTCGTWLSRTGASVSFPWTQRSGRTVINLLSRPTLTFGLRLGSLHFFDICLQNVNLTFFYVFEHDYI